MRTGVCNLLSRELVVVFIVRSILELLPRFITASSAVLVTRSSHV